MLYRADSTKSWSTGKIEKEFFQILILELHTELNNLRDEEGIQSEPRITLATEGRLHQLSETKRKELDRACSTDEPLALPPPPPPPTTIPKTMNSPFKLLRNPPTPDLHFAHGSPHP
jgi:hypothetical protein